MSIYVDYRSLERALTAYFGSLPHDSHCVCIKGGPSENLRGACWTLSDAANLLGYSRETINYWRRKGDLLIKHADRIAVKMDLMPYQIWPEWETWSIPANEFGSDVIL